MWKTFIYDDNIYMLKIENNDEYYDIYLTDLTKIWHSKLSRDLLVQKFQQCNPIVEVKIEDALTQVLKMLNEIDTAEVNIELFEFSVKLCIECYISNFSDSKFKMKYELILTISENDTFTKVVTIPLAQTVLLLEKQQNMMKNLLIKKDRQLEEYELEKGAISRSDLITEKFDLKFLILSSNNLMLNVFDKKCEDHITKKYGEIQEKVTEVDVEYWNNSKKKRKIYNKETAAKTKTNKIVYKGQKSV